MKLKSTAPDSVRVHESKADERPICPHCGHPVEVNNDLYLDPRHDTCWEEFFRAERLAKRRAELLEFEDDLDYTEYRVEWADDDEPYRGYGS